MKGGFVMLFSMSLDNPPAIQRIYPHWDRSAGRTSLAHMYYQAMPGRFVLTGSYGIDEKRSGNLGSGAARHARPDRHRDVPSFRKHRSDYARTRPLEPCWSSAWLARQITTINRKAQIRLDLNQDRNAFQKLVASPVGRRSLGARLNNCDVCRDCLHTNKNDRCRVDPYLLCLVCPRSGCSCIV